MPDVQMDYDLMEDMARLFKDGSQHLNDLIRSMQNVAGRLEDAAAVPSAGDVERMIAERQRIASRFRSEGEGEASRIGTASPAALLQSSMVLSAL